jgi:Family of unknown function (DUF6152)
MKLINTQSMAAALFGLFCLSALAHHSGNMFDSDKEVVLNGTVKEFQWSNPHIWIQINVPNDKGGMDEWSVEGGSPNLVGRQGWKRNSFKTGDKVVVTIHPMRSGEPGGSFVSAVFADGHTLGRKVSAPDAAKPDATKERAY